MPLVVATPRNLEKSSTNVVIAVAGGAVVMVMKEKNAPAVKKGS